MTSLGVKGDRPVSASENHPKPLKPGHSLEGPGESHAWMKNAKKLRDLLSALAAKQSSWRVRHPNQAAHPHEAFPRHRLDYRSHLQKCCERALDAHTIEDAIFWHSEIINELSIEIYSVGSKPWPDELKVQTAADLSELQSRHGAILHRLTGIVARNEQFIWHPQDLCKK
jgi:hypothetical protein